MRIPSWRALSKAGSILVVLGPLISNSLLAAIIFVLFALTGDAGGFLALYPLWFSLIALAFITVGRRIWASTSPRVGLAIMAASLVPGFLGVYEDTCRMCRISGGGRLAQMARSLFLVGVPLGWIGFSLILLSVLLALREVIRRPPEEGGEEGAEPG